MCFYNIITPLIALFFISLFCLFKIKMMHQKPCLHIYPVVYEIYVRLVFSNPEEVGPLSFDEHVLNRGINWVPRELRLAPTSGQQ